MTCAKSMRNIRQFEFDVIRLTRFERYRFLKALTILAAERLAANQLLIAAHL